MFFQFSFRKIVKLKRVKQVVDNGKWLWIQLSRMHEKCRRAKVAKEYWKWEQKWNEYHNVFVYFLLLMEFHKKKSFAVHRLYELLTKQKKIIIFITWMICKLIFAALYFYLRFTSPSFSYTFPLRIRTTKQMNK